MRPQFCVITSRSDQNSVPFPKRNDWNLFSPVDTYTSVAEHRNNDGACRKLHSAARGRPDAKAGFLGLGRLFAVRARVGGPACSCAGLSLGRLRIRFRARSTNSSATSATSFPNARSTWRGTSSGFARDVSGYISGYFWDSRSIRCGERWTISSRCRASGCFWRWCRSVSIGRSRFSVSGKIRIFPA